MMFYKTFVLLEQFCEEVIISSDYYLFLWCKCPKHPESSFTGPFFFSFISDLSTIPVNGAHSGNSLVEKRIKQLEDENKHLLKSIAGNVLDYLHVMIKNREIIFHQTRLDNQTCFL